MGLEGWGHRLGVSLSIVPTPGRTGRLERVPALPPPAEGHPTPRSPSLPYSCLEFSPIEDSSSSQVTGESFQTPLHPHPMICVF